MAYSDHPTHVKLYIGKQFNRLLKREAKKAFDQGDETRGIYLNSWRLKIHKPRKNARTTRGKTTYRNFKVTVPTFAIDRGRHYATYYMLHELAHVLTRGHGHDEVFRAKEEELLAEFGLAIVRKKRSKNGYPEHVLANGEIIG